MLLLFSADFFQKKKKKSKKILQGFIRVSNIFIQITTDILGIKNLMILIWVQAVCKG